MMIPLSQILSARRLLMFGGKKQQRHITTINITQPAQKLGSKLAGLKVSTVQMLVSYKSVFMHQNKALPNRSGIGIGHGNRSWADT